MAKRKNTTALFEVMSRQQREAASGGIFSSMKGWFASGRGESAPLQAMAEPQAPAAPPAEVAAPVARAEVPAEPRYVQLRLSYTAAVICVLSVATTVALAYLAGRQSAPGQRPLLAVKSTDQLREQPPQPLVTQVVDVIENPGRTEGTNVVPPGGGSGNLPVVSKNRVAGLNYVIIQGYPDEALAKAAQAVLQENGIETTIEKKLPGWQTPAQWYSVVGVHGFARLSGSSEYDAYLAKLKKVSDQYAKPRSFRAFSPQAYKWQR